MKIPAIAPLGALDLAVPAPCATTFNGVNIFTTDHWSNGGPSSTNPSTIPVGGSVDGVNILWGGVVKQMAGDIVAAGTEGCNLRSGAVWSMPGGSYTARYCNASSATFNMSGGTITITLDERHQADSEKRPAAGPAIYSSPRISSIGHPNPRFSSRVSGSPTAPPS